MTKRARKGKPQTATPVELEQIPRDETRIDRHDLFVAEYIIDLNATRAYKAVYSDGTMTDEVAAAAGSRLLRDVKISEQVRHALAAKLDRMKIDQDYVVRNVVEIAERCMERAPVLDFDPVLKRYVQRVDDKGNNVWTFDARNAVAANALLAKHTGGFIERRDLTSGGEKIIAQVNVTYVTPDPKRVDINRFAVTSGLKRAKADKQDADNN